MRLRHIHIRNFRGIRNYEADVHSRSALFYGPNGAGKSSVLQAIEFLLSGEIDELEGEGTGRESSDPYYHHRDVNPAESWVKARFGGSHEQIEVKRSVEDGELEILSDDDTIPNKLENQMQATELSQNRLRRDELLRYVAASPGKRANAVHKILRVHNTEDKRRAFSKAADDQKDIIGNQREKVKREKKRFLSSVADNIDEVESLDGLEEAFSIINDLREKFGASTIESLEAKEFTEGIAKERSEQTRHPFGREDLGRDFSELIEWFDQKGDDFIERYEELDQKISDLEHNEEVQRDIRSLALLRQGEELLGEFSPNCPLCLKKWGDPSDLEELIEHRQERASEAEELRSEIEKSRKNQLRSLSPLMESLETIVQILKEVKETHPDDDIVDNLSEIDEFYQNIKNYYEELNASEILHLPNPRGSEDLENLVQPKLIEKIIRDTRNEWRNITEVTDMPPYGVLAVAEDRFAQYQESRTELETLQKELDVLMKLDNHFQSARSQHYDKVLGSIKSEFSDIYEQIHYDDSEVDDFSVVLESTKAGVKFRVSYNDDKSHRPSLVFSEGHQDSMGLALFIAMAKVVGGESIEMLLLDDVLTSIDADHRTRIADLLGNHLGKDYQLIMTTHDKVWARRLRTSDNIQYTDHFARCDYYEGVHHGNDVSDPWGMIDYHLEEDDITAAAAWGRKTAEWFCGEGCQNFGVDLPSDRWGNLRFRDYFDPLLDKIDRLLEDQASTGGRYSHDDLEKLQQMVNELKTLSHKHIWGINENIHYGDEYFANFSKEELREDIEVFEQLYTFLRCPDCNGWRKFGRDEVYCGCGALWSI